MLLLEKQNLEKEKPLNITFFHKIGITNWTGADETPDPILKREILVFIGKIVPLVLFYYQGNAIGKCPKDKVFKGYIELELQLREFDRCRILYQKFLEFNPENCTTWMKVFQQR